MAMIGRTVISQKLSQPKHLGNHSDYGTITLLWQINDVSGLEVQDLGGVWHPVPYEEDGVVVNNLTNQPDKYNPI